MEDLFSVRDKVALVTGGTRGIGRMIAQGYVESGARVIVASRNAEACSETATELGKLGHCVGIPADLSDEDGAAALASAVAELEPEVHILVNNAGANWGAPLDEYPDSGWDKVFSLNLKGVFHTTVKLLPLLRKAAAAEDPARVINIGSIDGISPPDLETYAYSSCKAGLHHLTRVLAKRLAREDITVNAVAPGPFQSKMMAATLDQFGDHIRASNPRGRIGEPSDMAGVALFLASRAGAYVTGTVIPVDGGMSTT
ncbi:MAG: SDR family oxidoreductase [bacterium]|nr:SDR family oxidoreductase [bacterium]MCP5070334.1 SDR family oxidoreductase [bacterium]